jgi:hypothetical protein
MKPPPTAIVSVVAAVVRRKLRRLKSIDLKFGKCMQPMRSHMVNLPVSADEAGWDVGVESTRGA